MNESLYYILRLQINLLLAILNCLVSERTFERLSESVKDGLKLSDEEFGFKAE